MNAMTFESVGVSPRRAAARRNYRPDLRIVAVEKQPAVIAAARAENNIVGPRHKLELLAVIALTIALHVTAINALNNRSIESAPVLKKPPLIIEMAPPPKKEVVPPPPVVQPKPLPRVAKPAPIKRAVTPPSVPTVPNDTPVETTASADTVQVKTESTPEPPPVAAPVETVTEPRGYAGYLSNPAPNYPAAAQKRGLQGQVLLKVHVLASGKPDNVAVAKSSGHSILDDAAVKAVTEWVFEPAKRGKTPIDGWVQVPLNFKL